MSSLREAREGQVFFVKYAVLTNRSVHYAFWATAFEEKPDRLLFRGAKLPRSHGLNPERGLGLYAYDLSPPELDKKTTKIFIYGMPKPAWFDKKPASEVKEEEDFPPVDDQDEVKDIRQNIAESMDDILATLTSPSSG